MTERGGEALLTALSLEEAWRHLHWLEQNAPTRISGTPDQVRAGEYFAEQLDGLGLETHLDTFTGYRSFPGQASVTLHSPERAFPAVACGHIESTPDEGLDLDLVFVGGGAAEDYGGLDVRGRAVLAEISKGPARPGRRHRFRF